MFSNIIFWKSCHLRHNVEICHTARQATDDNIIWRMRIACCVTKATVTNSEYVILFAFPRQQFVMRKRLDITFIRTSFVLFLMSHLICRLQYPKVDLCVLQCMRVISMPIKINHMCWGPENVVTTVIFKSSAHKTQTTRNKNRCRSELQ